MLLLILAKDQDIVEINNNTLVQKRSEYIIHQGHECCRRVSQAEWEDQEFVVAITSSKGSLFCIVGVNSDLMVS